MATQVYTIAALIDALVLAVDAARAAAASDKRWLNAINSGYNWLLEQDAITFDVARHELTFTSENATYHANGVCQCKAFAEHNACRHRAAARLVRRALELLPAPVAAPAPTVAQRLARAQAAVMELYA